MAVPVNPITRGAMISMIRNGDSEWRRDGCGPRCVRIFTRVNLDVYASPVEVHDPDHHEAYGVNVLAYDMPAPLRGTVIVGSLSIDGLAMTVTVEGRVISLTPREFGMLGLLAMRPGEVVTQGEMLRTVWGSAYAPELGRRFMCANPNAHILRVNMARLRAKLGPARVHVKTVNAVGYMLTADVSS